MVKISLKNEFYKLVETVSPADEKDLEKIFCVRGSTAAFRVVFENDENIAVTVGDFDWFSHNSDVTVFRVEYEGTLSGKLSLVESVVDDDGLRKEDIILETDTMEYIKINGGIWCELSVPKDACLGTHFGKIKVYKKKMFEAETLVKTLDLKLFVSKYVLPDVSERSFHLDLWQHCSNIARHHDVRLWSDEHFSVLESYVKTLADIGQKTVTLIVSEIPWSGQSCFAFPKFDSNLFEYSMVKVTKRNGSFNFDYSAMQRYIDLCKKYGISDELSLYGLANVWSKEEYGFGKVSEDYPDGVRIRYYDENDGVFRYMTKSEEIDQYIRSLEQYFLATDQMSAVRLCADEPADVVAYKASIDHILSIAPSFKLKAAINHAEFIGEFEKEIFDFVPYVGCLQKEYDKVKKFQKEMPDKRFLWYVCCGPDFPNTFIKSPLRESAFIGILTSYMELDGFLRWNYTVYNKDPRKSIVYGSFPAGDINFVYPSYNGGALLTLRYKALLRGLEYYTMLEALKESGLRDELNECYDIVIKEKNIKNYYGEGFSQKSMMCDNDAMSVFVEKLVKSLDKIGE